MVLKSCFVPYKRITVDIFETVSFCYVEQENVECKADHF